VEGLTLSFLFFFPNSGSFLSCSPLEFFFGSFFFFFKLLGKKWFFSPLWDVFFLSSRDAGSGRGDGFSEVLLIFFFPFLGFPFPFPFNFSATRGM